MMALANMGYVKRGTLNEAGYYTPTGGGYYNRGLSRENEVVLTILL